MKSYSPDKKSMNFLRAASALTALLMIAAVRIFIEFYALMLTLCIILSVTALIVIFVYLPMYFSSLSYIADENEITKTSGVLFRKVQTVKLSSVQYCTEVFTPFSKCTGLNFIIFYAHGGKLAVIFLEKNDISELLALCGAFL